MASSKGHKHNDFTLTLQDKHARARTHTHTQWCLTKSLGSAPLPTPAGKQAHRVPFAVALIAVMLQAGVLVDQFFVTAHGNWREVAIT